MSSSTIPPTRPTPLYIFTTSQTPLPVRYPRPHKPVLNIPPLIHRSLHLALDAEPPSILLPGSSSSSNGDHSPVDGATFSGQPAEDTPQAVLTNTSSSPSSQAIIIPHPDHIPKQDIPSALDDSENEITLKLHLGSPSHPSSSGATPTTRTWSQSTSEALHLLSTHLGIHGADTLLIGFRGVDYRGKKSAASEMFGCGSEGLENPSSEDVDPGVEEEIMRFWKGLSDVLAGQSSHSQTGNGEGERRIGRVGTLYLPLGLLRRLSDEGKSEAGSEVSINALDTPDCHSLPKEYTTFAKERGIELWAGGGGEGSDPLPAAELHNLLQEFSPSPIGSDLCQAYPALKELIPRREDGLKWEEGAKRGVAVRWVLGYTLVSKSRNLVRDKGYVVAAELLP